MLQLALSNRNHKNGNSPRESELAGADDTARGAVATTAAHDTDLETNVDADVVRELAHFRQRLCRRPHGSPISSAGSQASNQAEK